MVPGVGPQCQLTSPAAVAAAFGGRVSVTKVSTSGLGNPMCVFTLATFGIHAGGTVTMSLDASSSAAQFAAVKKQVHGRTVTGLADGAFYVGNTSTMQFRSGTTSVVVQATMKARAGTQYASRITADITAISKVIAAQI